MACAFRTAQLCVRGLHACAVKSKLALCILRPTVAPSLTNVTPSLVSHTEHPPSAGLPGAEQSQRMILQNLVCVGTDNSQLGGHSLQEDLLWVSAL